MYNSLDFALGSHLCQAERKADSLKVVRIPPQSLLGISAINCVNSSACCLNCLSMDGIASNLFVQKQSFSNGLRQHRARISDLSSSVLVALGVASFSCYMLLRCPSIKVRSFGISSFTPVSHISASAGCGSEGHSSTMASSRIISTSLA